MTTLYETLKPEDKEKLSKLYKELTGKDYVPPKKIDIREIDRLMKENRGVGHD